MPTPANQVRRYLLDLQERIVSTLEAFDGARFHTDAWTRPNDNGDGITRVIENGRCFERGGVNFSHVKGHALPASATATRKDLENASYEAMGVSLVLHPRNPYCPTAHMNVRFFIANPESEEEEAAGKFKFFASPLGATHNPQAGSRSRRSDPTKPTWWFGGGMDLTPYYPFVEDVQHFHRTNRDALASLDVELYPRFKAWCDRYFFIKHRNETRGVGGVFFDDFNEGTFAHSFKVASAIGDAFIPAYLPILERRQETAYGERERAFQAYRRGRYVEFNLVHDRGTLFGLQSGGRTESILMSMPPMASWRYDWHPEPGSAEAKLYDEFLIPKDWA